MRTDPQPLRRRSYPTGPARQLPAPGHRALASQPLPDPRLGQRRRRRYLWSVRWRAFRDSLPGVFAVACIAVVAYMFAAEHLPPVVLQAILEAE